jgi:CRISPR-associated protein Cas2
MFEIDTNVFVGRMSARVRDEIWKRVVEFSADGRAVLVYTVNNEQRFEFRTHNSKGEVVDLDGIKLFMKPSENKTE